MKPTDAQLREYEQHKARSAADFDEPYIQSNETFGPCLYYTTALGPHVWEFGIKSSGVRFEVH